MFGDEIKIIISAIDKTGDVFKNVSKNLEGVGKSITSVGKNITLLTAPLAIFGVLSVKTFGDFNSEIQRAGSYVDATADQIKEFGDVAIKAAKGTTFSAVEVAKALGSFMGGSIDAATATKELGGVIDFALISRFENLDDAINSSYMMLTQFSKEGLIMKNVTDTMAVALSNVLSAGQTQQYAKAMGTVSGAVKSAGWDFKDLNVILSAFAAGGADLNESATAINNSLNFLRAPSDSAKTALDNAGLSVEGLANAIEEGPIPMLEYLRQGFVDGEGKIKDYAGFIDVVSRTAAPELSMALGTTSERLKEVAGYFDDVNGKSDTMLQTIKDNIPPLTGLRNELEKLAIQVGSILVPILIPLIEKLKEVFAWFEGLSPETQKIIVYLGLFAVALGPLLIILGTLITSITAVAGVLAAITLPIAVVILAIGGLVAAGIYLVANWEKAKGGILYIWETIQNAVETSINFIKEKWNEAITFLGFWKNEIMRNFTDIGNFLLGVVLVWAGFLKPIWQPWVDNTRVVFSWITTQVGAISDFVFNVFNQLKTALIPIWKGISNDIETIWNGIKTYFSNTWEGIKIIFNEAINWLMRKIQPFLDIYEKVKEGTDWMGGKIGKGVDWIGGEVKGAIGKIKEIGKGGIIPELRFAEGGIVPGSIGQPIPALVHGGETIIPYGKGLGNINLTITGNTFMSDREAALRIGDIIIQQLKMNLRF